MNGQEFLVFFLVYGIAIFCILQFAITYYLNNLYPANNFSEANYQDLSNYEIAYLIGGPGRLFETLIFSLIAKGFLVKTNFNELSPSYLVKTALPNDGIKIESIEYTFMKNYNYRPADVLFDPKDKKHLIHFKKAYSTFGTQVHNELSEIGLLLFNKEKVLLYTFKAIAISLIIGLSFYRINYALAHGHHNIFFLIILTIIFTIIIAKFFKFSSISPHGTLLIKSLQKNYEKEKDEKFNELSINKKFNFSKNRHIDKSIFLFSIFGLNAIPVSLWEFNFLSLLNPQRTIDNYHNSSSDSSDWSLSNDSGSSSSGCSSSDSSSSDSGGDSSCGSGCGGCGGGGD